MTTTYAILVDGEQVAEMTADFAQASSPIMMDGDSTPYQVADAKHRRKEAAIMLLAYAWSNGGPVCEMDELGAPVGEVDVVEIVAEKAE